MKLRRKVGHTFGLLTVLRRDVTRLDRVYWICRCSCGVLKSVRTDKLGKDTISCGHYNRELIRKSKEGAKSSLFKNTKSRLFYYTVVKPLHDRIKQRDGNACVLCGTKKNLHVHHILRKSKYPKLLSEPANLICLCEFCHIMDAHNGNTNTINLALSETLLTLSFLNELKLPTPIDLINKIQKNTLPFLKDL